MKFERFSILGVEISRLHLPQAVRLLLRFLESGNQGYVCCAGVHSIVEAQDDPQLMQVLNNSVLTTPDGMPTVWIGRRAFGYEEMGRVYGPDLMLSMFEATQDKDVRHYFCGGHPGVADDLREAMLRRFPNAQIVGTYSPPFHKMAPKEEEDMLLHMERARPDIIWVGLGSPKQDLFMARFIERSPAKLMFGVGAAFDFFTGKVPQAPRWIQRSGFEWLFRLCQEPERLWERYSRSNPRFVCLILGQLLQGAFAGRMKIASKSS